MTEPFDYDDSMTDEQVVESYMSEGMSRDDAEAMTTMLRHPGNAIVE